MISTLPLEIRAVEEMSRMEGEGITGCSKVSFKPEPKGEGDRNPKAGARTLQAERTA